MQTPHLTMRIPPDLLASLREIAAIEGRSVGGQARLYIEAGVDFEHRQRSQAIIREANRRRRYPPPRPSKRRVAASIEAQRP